MEPIRTNSAKAWILASRPKTLAAAATPVIVGSGLAYSQGGFRIVPAIICMVFALLMQIAANLINDIIDYKKGSDDKDRLGPQRATSEGWITEKAMMKGIGVVIATACLAGLVILFYTTWEMIFVGLLCVIFAYFYTSGPYPLSYNGLGDMAVVIFFGLVPVGFTCYCQSGMWDTNVTLISICVGLVVNTLLVVNNYRDRDTDKKNGKNTLVVKLGEKAGEMLYLMCGLVAAIVTIYIFIHESKIMSAPLPIIYLAFHIATKNELCRINKGKELNKLIGKSSRNMMIYAITTTIGLCI